MYMISPSKSLLFPKPPVDYDFPSAVQAIKLQNDARILRIAAFALANFALSAACVLLEVNVALWPGAVACGVVALVALGILWMLNRNDERYVEGLTYSKRSQLAKEEIVRLVSLPKMQGTNSQTLRCYFEDVNRVFGYGLFDEFYLKRLQAIWGTALEGQTLLQAASMNGIPLKIQLSTLHKEKGQFGWPSQKARVRMSWDGKNLDSFELGMHPTTSNYISSEAIAS